MNVPIFPENLEDGRSPLQGAFAGLFGGHRERGGGLRRRMGEEILRARRVMTSESGFIENRGEREVARKVETKTKTIADDIIFVNNGGVVGNGIRAGSPTGNGTAERPVDAIGLGVERLASRLGGSGTIYVQGGNAPYGEDVSVGFDGTGTGSNDGTGVRRVSFVSSFKGIRACGRYVFGGDTPRPVTNGFDIRGGPSGSVVSAEVIGFEMNGLAAGPHAGNGLYAENVPDLLVNCNVIRSTLDGADAIHLQYDADLVGNVVISENRIVTDAIAADGVDLNADALAFLDVVLRNNTITTFGFLSDGVDVETTGMADVIFDLYGNRVTTWHDESSGTDFEAYDDSILDTIMAGNTFRTHGDLSDGVELLSDDDSLVISALIRNRIVTSGEDADGVDLESFGDSVLDAFQLGNRITVRGEISDGIDAEAHEGSLMVYTSVGDRVTTTAPDAWGHDLYAEDFAELNASIFGGTIATESDSATGIWFEIVDSAVGMADFEDNRIDTLGDSSPGIVVVSDTTAAPVEAILGGNTIFTIGTDSDGLGVISVTDVLFLTNPAGDSNTVSTLGASDIFIVPGPPGSPLGTVIVNGNVVAPPVTGDYP